jgi:hypothetical protein
MTALSIYKKITRAETSKKQHQPKQQGPTPEKITTITIQHQKNNNKLYSTLSRLSPAPPNMIIHMKT